MLIALGVLNVQVEQGSVMDSPLLDSKNLYVLEANRGALRGLSVDTDARVDVRIKKKDGLISRDGLRAAVMLCDRAAMFFETNKEVRGVGVHCLSTAKDYAGERGVKTFLSLDEVMQPHFDSERWWKKYQTRHDVAGVLFQETQDMTIAMAVFFVPSSVSETAFYRTLKSFLEERTVGDTDLVFSPSIVPHRSFYRFERGTEAVFADVEIIPVGWPIARVELYAASREDLFVRIIPAIAIFGFFVMWKKLRSAKLAALGFCSVLFGLVFTRATLAVFAWMAPIEGTLWREEIFTILAYVVALVPGFSFALRRLTAFSIASGIAKERWMCSTSHIRGPFAIVAGISALDFLLFLALPDFYGSRSIFEIGVLSTVGIGAAWFSARYLLPVLHQCAGGGMSEKNLISAHSKGMFGRVVAFVSTKVVSWARHPYAAIIGVCVTITFVGLAVLGIVLGSLKTESDPRELIAGTQSQRALQTLERQGEAGGFNTHTLHVLPRKGSVNDPKYADALIAFVEELRNERSVRVVASPSDILQNVISSDFKEEWRREGGSVLHTLSHVAKVKGERPEEMLRVIWRDIKNESPNVATRFIGKDAIVLSVAGGESSAGNMKALRTRIKEIGVHYPDLVLELPGKISLFPEVDTAILDGFFFTTALSLIFLGVLGGWWIWRSALKVGVCVGILGGGVVVLVPFCAALATLFLVMMTLGIPLDIGTTAIGAVAISVAVDFPIFLAAGFVRAVSEVGSKQALSSETVRREIETVIADSLLNAPPFLILCFSVFPPVFRLGLLFSLVIAVCALATLFVVLPLLERMMSKK